jgi:uncharacterized protein YkwD
MPFAPSVRRGAALGAVVAGLAFVPAPASAAGCADADTMPTTENIGTVRQATLCLLNHIRHQHHRHGLRSNAALQEVAQRYSQQMVTQQFFDHVSPAGSTFVQRIRTTDYLSNVTTWSLGENLAWGSGYYGTPRETVKGWMHSPGHRHNILEPRYREIGIGIAPGAPVDVGGVQGATYTTEFGKRTRR